MTLPAGYVARLLYGIGERLHAGQLATLNPTHEPYPPGVMGIYFGHAPAGIPHNTPRLVIAHYMDIQGELSIEETRIQIRAWHPGMDALAIHDWMEQVRDLFPPDRNHLLGGVWIDHITYLGGTLLPETAQHELTESVQNFQLRGNRYNPTIERTN